MQPILLYGAQLYCPLVAPKQLLGLAVPVLTNFFDNHSRFGPEPVHVRYMKWILGVHKKAFNVFCWSELGEFPLLFDGLKLALSYFQRLLTVPSNTLIYHTFKEQEKLGLKWFTIMNALTTKNLESSGQLVRNLKDDFIFMCKVYNVCHSKPEFLLETRSKYGFQFYLQIIEDFNTRRSISKLRSSSHCLEIEVGRYTDPITHKDNRYCAKCQNMGNAVVEKEKHFLRDCPVYDIIRRSIYNIVPEAQDNPLCFISTSKNKDAIRVVARGIAAMYRRRSREKDNNAHHPLEELAIDSLVIAGMQLSGWL